MKLERVEFVRIPRRARFYVDRLLIARQAEAKRELVRRGVDVRAVRSPR